MDRYAGTPGSSRRREGVSPGRAVSGRHASSRGAPSSLGRTPGREEAAHRVTASLRAHAAVIDANFDTDLGRHPVPSPRRPARGSSDHYSSFSPHVPEVDSSPRYPTRDSHSKFVDRARQSSSRGVSAASVPSSAFDELEAAYSTGRHRGLRTESARDGDEAGGFSRPPPSSPHGHRAGRGPSRSHSNSSAQGYGVPDRVEPPYSPSVAPDTSSLQGQRVAQLQAQVRDAEAKSWEQEQVAAEISQHIVALGAMDGPMVELRMEYALVHQTALEHEVVELHTELTKVTGEKAALQVQVEGLSHRLQRSETNAEELAGMLEAALGLPSGRYFLCSCCCVHRLPMGAATTPQQLHASPPVRRVRAELACLLGACVSPSLTHCVLTRGQAKKPMPPPESRLQSAAGSRGVSRRNRSDGRRRRPSSSAQGR